MADGAESSNALFRAHFEKVGVAKAQAILNVLLESPFFYRDDDVDLFGVLRRNTPAFRAFFETCLGWDLYVDSEVARTIKPKVHNSQLTAAQRHVFQLTSRDECMLFMLLLEFQEEESDRQNVDLRRGAELNFVLSDYFAFVFRRYRDVLGDATPSDEDLLKGARNLFKKLLQHRFLAEAAREGIVEEAGISAAFTREGSSSVLFTLLPGMRCYRPEALSQQLMLQSYDAKTAALREERHEEGEEADGDGRQGDVSEEPERQDQTDEASHAQA